MGITEGAKGMTEGAEGNKARGGSRPLLGPAAWESSPMRDGAHRGPVNRPG